MYNRWYGPIQKCAEQYKYNRVGEKRIIFAVFDVSFRPILSDLQTGTVFYINICGFSKGGEKRQAMQAYIGGVGWGVCDSFLCFRDQSFLSCICKPYGPY